MSSTPQNINFQFKKNTFYLPKLAEMVLQDAKTCYEEQNKFSAQIYQQLAAIFDADLLISALDILDRYKFVKYKVISGRRCIYRISSRVEQFLLSENINFCRCTNFIDKVMKNPAAILCEHILALKLAQIVRNIHDEVVTNAQMKNILDCDVENYLGFRGFDEND